MVYIVCLVLALISTIAICIGIGLIKWALAQVGLTIFLSLFLILLALFLLALVEPEGEYDE